MFNDIMALPWQSRNECASSTCRPSGIAHDGVMQSEDTNVAMRPHVQQQRMTRLLHQILWHCHAHGMYCSLCLCLCLSHVLSHTDILAWHFGVSCTLMRSLQCPHAAQSRHPVAPVYII